MAEWAFEETALSFMDLTNIEENFNLFEFLSFGGVDDDDEEGGNTKKKPSPRTQQMGIPNNNNSPQEQNYYHSNEVNFNQFNFSSNLMNKKIIKSEYPTEYNNLNNQYPNKRNHSGEYLHQNNQNHQYNQHYYQNIKQEYPGFQQQQQQGDSFGNGPLFSGSSFDKSNLFGSIGNNNAFGNINPFNSNNNAFGMNNNGFGNGNGFANNLSSPFSLSSFNSQHIKNELSNLTSSSKNITTPIQQPQMNISSTSNITSGLSQLKILTQPPIEVRLRTNGDKRCFKVKVQLKEYQENTEVAVELLYSKDRLCNTYRRVDKQEILGGTKKVKVESDGAASFKNLCIWEASKKHGEREFSLRFFILGKGDNEDINSPFLSYSVISDPFYTYSHQRILSKRKALSVRTLNKSWGVEGEVMHIVGKGFIDGPHIGVVVIRKDGTKFACTSVEFYSESVIFFQLPDIKRSSEEEVEVDVCVTNDGRSFSNPSKLVYQKTQR